MAKSVILIVLALASVALGVLYAQERAQTVRLAARVAELEAQAGRQHQEIQKQTQAVAELAKEKTRLSAKADAAKQKLVAMREAAAATDAPVNVAAASQPDVAATGDENGDGASKDSKSPAKNGWKDYIGKMMKDPAMRKMVRSSQEVALKQMYGDLVKQWNMSPDEASAFYGMLSDKNMALFDRSDKALSEGGDMTSVVKTTEDSDAALKASLGDPMYQQYKDYEKTVTDRMMLNQFKAQLGTDSGQPLTEDQSAYLMRVMGEERQNRPPGGMFGQDAAATMAKGQFTMDQAQVDAMIKSQTDLNDRVAQRASAMLNPQQVDSFKKYQQQMLDMQKMGMEMAAKMSGGKP